jgi:hypothetical protein
MFWRHHSSRTHPSRRAAGEAQLRVSGSTATQPDERSWAQRLALSGRSSGSSREGTDVPDNIVLIMRFHPVGGEDVSVVCAYFTGEHEALEAVASALDERRSLVLPHARYDRQADENGVIINLANVVSLRLSRTDSAAAGQYM